MDWTRSFSHENNAVRFIRPILNVGPVPIFLPAYRVDLSKQPSQPVESGELWTILDLEFADVPVI
jgi:hypothetical protein